MERLHGSPADMTGRSDREIRTFAFFDRPGIAFERTDRPGQSAASMEVCSADFQAAHGIPEGDEAAVVIGFGYYADSVDAASAATVRSEYASCVMGLEG